MKNRRANIPVTILAIGIFVVCTLAFFSFLVAMNKFGNSFSEKIDLVEKASSEIEKNSLNNYHQEIVDDGFWFWDKPKVIFSVSYTSP